MQELELGGQVIRRLAAPGRRSEPEMMVEAQHFLHRGHLRSDVQAAVQRTGRRRGTGVEETRKLGRQCLVAGAGVRERSPVHRTGEWGVEPVSPLPQAPSELAAADRSQQLAARIGEGLGEDRVERAAHRGTLDRQL